jgi:hypothetical protein
LNVSIQPGLELGPEVGLQTFERTQLEYRRKHRERMLTAQRAVDLWEASRLLQDEMAKIRPLDAA